MADARKADSKPLIPHGFYSHADEQYAIDACPACLKAERDRYKAALERIRDIEVEEPIDEWSEAAAFNVVLGLAEDALNGRSANDA